MTVPTGINKQFIEAAARGDLQGVREILYDNEVTPYWRGFAVGLAHKNRHSEVFEYLTTLGSEGEAVPLSVYDHLLDDGSFPED